MNLSFPSFFQQSKSLSGYLTLVKNILYSKEKGFYIFFLLLANRLNFTFHSLLDDVWELPSSEYSPLNDEQYVMQKSGCTNVDSAVRKTKPLLKYQRQVY